MMEQPTGRRYQTMQATRTPDDVTDFLERPPERRSRAAAKRGKGCLAVFVALAVIVAGGVFAWQKLSGFAQQLMAVPDYTNPKGTADIRFTVPSGASLTMIGDSLQSHDVIKSTKAWRKAIEKYDGNPVVQAGTYRLRTQVPAATALDQLTHPATYLVRNNIQVLEGLRLSDQLTVLSRQTKIPLKDYKAALKHPGQLGLPAWANGNAEGFLFPDTYQLTDHPTATSVLKQMIGRFNTVSADIDLEHQAKAMHKSPYDVLIVASIIEKEVRRPQDRSKAARVIWNRLAQRMPLQMDSTVHYAVHKSDRVTTTNADRANPSPYNTYVHTGLPPGPISAPSKASLAAAANPASGSWLYFVTVNPDTGETRFATTYAEHQANIAQFQHWCGKHPGRC